MTDFRILAGFAIAAVMFCASQVNAQATDPEPPPDGLEEQADEDVIDEITVIAGPQGQTAYELEMERREAMREAIYADIRMRDRHKEDVAWRQEDPDLKRPESRIKWGYSAQAEQRMRRQNDFMYDLSIDHNKPVSLFRVEF